MLRYKSWTSQYLLDVDELLHSVVRFLLENSNLLVFLVPQAFNVPRSVIKLGEQIVNLNLLRLQPICQ